jgi:hypothetical protein
MKPVPKWVPRKATGPEPKQYNEDLESLSVRAAAVGCWASRAASQVARIIWRAASTISAVGPLPRYAVRPRDALPDFSTAVRTLIDEVDPGHAPMGLDLPDIHRK